MTDEPRRRDSVEARVSEMEARLSARNAQHDASAAAAAVTLHEFFTQRLSDIDRRISERFTAIDAALNEFKVTTGEKLATMNEFRAALGDLSKLMATRSEMETLDRRVQEMQRTTPSKDQFDGLDLQVQEIRRVLSNEKGSSVGMRDMYGWIFGAVGLLLALGIAIWKGVAR